MAQSSLETIDYDPFTDLSVYITIHAIRALNYIESTTKPNFFLTVIINGQIFTSPTWTDMEHIYPEWTASKNIPDDEEFVNISIELWDKTPRENILCDLHGAKNHNEQGKALNIYYNIKTGHWHGDDYLNDPDGYGRGCGTTDGSIYENEYDCELWFDVYQNDYDNDKIPYWMEVNYYGTDPELDNTGLDADNDSIPIEWEHKWGFNPIIWDDHEHMDHDQDSITNVEEWMTQEFGSDPFRQDIFLELDFMEDAPDGSSSRITDEAVELLKNPFHRRNILVHVDTTQEGGDIIPFTSYVSFDDVIEIYNEYFLNNTPSNWKRSVFHYGIIAYKAFPNGYGFSGDVSPYIGYIPGTNGFVISSSIMERNTRRSLTKTLSYFYGSAIMHEMGHNFGIRGGNPPGCDVQLSKWPWQIGYWYYRTYKSIMNYRYTYKIFDYSDGSHGKRDHDDWESIDLAYFEIPE